MFVGPDRRAGGRISNGHKALLQLRRQQGGGWILLWAGIIIDELDGTLSG